MDVQFENRFYPTDEMLWNCTAGTIVRTMRRAVLAGVGMCLPVALTAWRLGTWGLAAFFGAAVLLMAGGVLASWFPARRTALSPGREQEQIVQFGARIFVLDGDVRFWTDYEAIAQVRRLRGVSVLLLNDRDAILIAETGFTKGSAAEFWQFLACRRPDLKLRAAEA